jgi:hypothetical protein
LLLPGRKLREAERGASDCRVPAVRVLPRARHERAPESLSLPAMHFRVFEPRCVFKAGCLCFGTRGEISRRGRVTHSSEE